MKREEKEKKREEKATKLPRTVPSSSSGSVSSTRARSEVGRKEEKEKETEKVEDAPTPQVPEQVLRRSSPVLSLVCSWELRSVEKYAQSLFHLLLCFELFVHGILDIILRSPGIWQSLVRCLPLLRSTS